MINPKEDVRITAVHLTSNGFLQVWGNPELKEKTEFSVPSTRECILQGSQPTLDSISPDRIYLTVDPEDGHWYRCRVLELIQRTHMTYVRILFIDTGCEATKSYEDLIETKGGNLVGAAKCFNILGIQSPHKNKLWCETAMDALGTLLQRTVTIENITIRYCEGQRNIDLYMGECQDILRTLFTYKVAKCASNSSPLEEEVLLWRIESPSSFSVVPVASDKQAQLLEYILNHEDFTRKAINPKSIRRGVFCLVLSRHISGDQRFEITADEVLARGQILLVEKVVENGYVVVQMVDYGRRERVPFDVLYEMDAQVKDYPPVAKSLSIDGLVSRIRCQKMACPFGQKHTNDVISRIQKLTINCSRKGDKKILKVLQSDANTSRAKFFAEDKNGDAINLRDKLIKGFINEEGAYTRSLFNPSWSEESERMSTIEVSPGVLYDMKITSIEKDKCFWLSPTEFQENLSSLNDTIETVAQNLEVLSNDEIIPGKICGAPWREEKSDRRNIYRAEILSNEDSYVIVQFIDYGNMASVSPTELLNLPKALKELPKQAIYCTLYESIKNDEILEEQIAEQILEIFNDERVVGMEVLKLACCSNEPHTINILNNGNPMVVPPTQESLVCLRLGEQQLCLKEVSKHDDFVELRGIPLSKQNEFEDIHQILNTKLGATNNILQQFFVGDHVAAKMGKRWCRAVVEEIFPFRDLTYEFSCKYQVRYLDLGSHEILLDEFVAELPKEVFNIPALFVSVQIPLCDRSSNVDALVGKYITLNIISVRNSYSGNNNNIVYEGTCDFDKYCDYQISAEIYDKYQEVKTQQRSLEDLERNGQMLKVKIENHTIDDRFYLSLDDEVDEFHRFKTELAETCESAPPVTSLSGNAHNFIVGANIPFFGWVRCRVVEKITLQNAEVELLDHSDQSRRINLDQMVKLPNKFIEMKKRTISCRLLNPDLRVDRLRVVAKLSEGEFTAKFVNEFEDGVFMVEIYSEGKLLNDTMRMEMDFTGRKSVYASEPISVGALLDVQVIRAHVARTFAIRKKTKEHYRLRDSFHDEFEAYRSRAIDMPCNREFEVGDAVATMTPEGYMRGEVERVLDDGHVIQVHCVDTALSLMQAEHLVHALPKAFVAKFPAQAIYCTTFGYYDEKKEDFVDHILKQFVVTHGTNNLSAKVLATSVMNGKKILIVDLFSLSESLIGAYRKFGVGYDTPVYPMFEDPIFTFTSWMASDSLKKGMEIAVTMCSVSEVYGEKVVNIKPDTNGEELQSALKRCIEKAADGPENPHHIGVILTRTGPYRVQTASKKALFCVDEGFTVKSGETIVIPTQELLKIPAQSTAVTLCDTDHFNEYEWAKFRRFCTERHRVVAKVEGQKNGLPVIRIDLRKYGFHMKPLSQEKDLIGMPFWHECQARDQKKILQPEWSNSPNESFVNKCMLLYIDSLHGHIHVRHKNTEEVFLVLQDEMERTYFPARHNDYRPPRIDIGDIVAAKLHSSQQWYRGIIMQKLSHEAFITAYKVMLLDAGGIVYIPACSIKVLTPSLRRTPQLAMTYDLGDDLKSFNTAQVCQIKAMFAAEDCALQISENLYTVNVSSSQFELPLRELLQSLKTSQNASQN